MSDVQFARCDLWTFESLFYEWVLNFLVSIYFILKIKCRPASNPVPMICIRVYVLIYF